MKTPNNSKTTTVATAVAVSSSVNKSSSTATGGVDDGNENAAGAVSDRGGGRGMPPSDGMMIYPEGIGGPLPASTTTTVTPSMRRRRRRRNPTEKAELAARMAAAAAAALRERNARRAVDATSGESTRATKKIKAEGEGINNELVVQDEVGGDNSSSIAGGGGLGGIEAIEAAGVVLDEATPFSEEELKTLGSGDDEDIPAARRAAMASALALRAAAGGSPVEPPKSASEVNFDIADPPLLPIVPPSALPALSSATLMTENDVLCGRGGGTNSQTGNRRFRALVRDFQPTYLMAKRRDKPRMARSVVLIVRHRGGRFLRRDDTDGRLYEVGDEKAEAKTSQALREGLDVRATKTAANTLMSSSGGGGGGCTDSPLEIPKKRGNVTNANHTVIVGGSRESKDKSTPSKPPIPMRGYGSVPPRHAGPGGVGGGGFRPPYLGGYSEAYYRSRYPMYEYRGPPISHHPVTGSYPLPPTSTMHPHPQYFGGRTADASAAAGGVGYHYPTAYHGGFVDPRAVYPPSPPRSSSRKIGGDNTDSALPAVKTA